MKHDPRRLIILISIFSLLAVLVLNFFFFQKSDQDTYLQALQDRVQAVDKEFDEDFIQILMNVRPDDTLSFGQISTPVHSHPFLSAFFILFPTGRKERRFLMYIIRTDHQVNYHASDSHIKPDRVCKFNNFSVLHTLICISVVIGK